MFNADSKKRQEQNFMAASKLAQQAKARFEAYIGYAYGKKKETGRGKPKMYRELAGKQFWSELTGDENFYLKIIKFMGTCQRNMWTHSRKAMIKHPTDW